MIFVGIRKIFSTKNENQYNSIGEFWDELSKIYGKENLRGLGYNWTSDTIEYVIGLKNGICRTISMGKPIGQICRNSNGFLR